jgi:outer membrane protein
MRTNLLIPSRTPRWKAAHPVFAALCVAALLMATAAGAQPASPTLPAGVDITKPVSLADAVRIALMNSPTMSVATQQPVQSASTVTQTRATQKPNLSLSWIGTNSKSAGSTTTSSGTTTDRDSTTTRVLELALSQTFYESGLREQIRAAQALLRASVHGVDDTRRVLILDVAQAYFTAQAAEALVDVQRQGVITSRQHLEMANARIEQGLAAAADRYSYETELAQAQVSTINAENEMEVTLADLKRVIGLSADTPMRLSEPLAQPALPDNLQDLIKAAYANRPDVLQLQAQVDAARENLRVAHINRGVTVSATGSAGWGNYSGDASDRWQLQVGVGLPIFDGDLTRAKEQTAQSQLTVTEEKLRQMQLTISNEISTNYATAVRAQARIPATESAVKSAGVALDAAQGRYQEDMAYTVEVTDAELKLRTAQSDHIQALYDYNSALAALRASLGQSAVPAIQ